MKVLLVEDDNSIRKIVELYLQKNGYDVTSTAFGKEGQEFALNDGYDCIIMDVELPDANGIDILKKLRDNDNYTPLLIISATKNVETKVEGLDSGADDYITKPFDFKELLARIKTITRRRNHMDVGDTKEILNCGELTINLLKREFKIGDKTVFLTNNEFNLLTYFIKNKNRIISRKELSENVWRIYFDTQTNFVNVYISYLRKKIREHTDFEYIETIRGEGFRITCS
ncbi:MAG TPA: response regulator transcription factor [Balneolales bacterium]|nr:response regulator transcription factor [Balneolales bacterium]